MANRVATKKRKRAARPDGRPGGDKRTRAAMLRLVELVDQRLTSGVPRYAIVAELERKGVARSTVDRYIATVEARWQAESKAAEPSVREQALARLTALSIEAQGAGEYASVARFEHMRCTILGVYAPHRHDVRALVATTEAPQVDLSLVSDDELSAIKSAAAKLAQKAPAGLVGDTTAVEAKAS
jgi:carboxylesterase type B